MCKSFEVSVLTGIYSYAIAYYLYRRNLKYDRAISIVLFVFSTIQWLEAILWYDLSNLMINRFATTLIPIVLGLEFLASLYAASMYFDISKLEIIIYIISFILLNFMWYKSSTGVSTVDLNTGSLLWGGIGIGMVARCLFLILILYPLFRFVPTSLAIILFISLTIIFFFYAFRYGDTFGSNWCWIANLVALTQLYAPIFTTH